MRKTKVIAIFLLGIIVGFALSTLPIGDNVSVNGKSDKEVIKIGVMTMLSGDLALIGENVVNAIEIAIEDLGLPSENIELIVEDVGGLGDQSQAVSALEKLVEVDRVEIIVNGMSSNAALAIAPLLDEYEVVALYPFTGGTNIDLASD